MKTAGLTHTGCVRSLNEDAILINETAGLMVVADGMGEYDFGEIASRIIIDTFRDYVKPASHTSVNRRYDKGCHSEQTLLKKTILKAHHKILEEVKRRSNASVMASTVVVARCDQSTFNIAWVGDSRAYLWNKNRGLKLMTRDHSYVETLIKEGAMSAEEARSHPGRSIVTQSLGHNVPEPDSLSAHWDRGDRLLLCSDGLTDELDHQSIASILADEPDLGQVIKKLVDEALRQGGKDNISVLIAENDIPPALEKDQQQTGLRACLLPLAVSVLLTLLFVALWVLL